LPEPGHIEACIRSASFEPLGWLEHSPEAGFDGSCLLLVGNAGPAMYERFAAQRDRAHDKMDDWTREVLAPLATQLGAQAVFPFDVPHPPFLRWARAARAGFTSPLGLNIRADFGLWHAFRAAFIFKDDLTIPACADAAQVPPCETCAGQAVPHRLPGQRVFRHRLRRSSVRRPSWLAARRAVPQRWLPCAACLPHRPRLSLCARPDAVSYGRFHASARRRPGTV
jgi:hypothetical protein